MSLEERMDALIEKGMAFTADDLTNQGEITYAGSHDANGSNSGIGSMFSRERKAGRIEAVGYANSTSPRRKGNVIRVWQPVK